MVGRTTTRRVSASMACAMRPMAPALQSTPPTMSPTTCAALRCRCRASSKPQTQRLASTLVKAGAGTWGAMAAAAAAGVLLQPPLPAVLPRVQAASGKRLRTACRTRRSQRTRTSLLTTAGRCHSLGPPPPVSCLQCKLASAPSPPRTPAAAQTSTATATTSVHLISTSKTEASPRRRSFMDNEAAFQVCSVPSVRVRRVVRTSRQRATTWASSR
mmetsp:Transcript_26158/g.57312  ORF Transcript_26158/g.57312 Transcript_26158/m.57312 type:complete len:215 (-) Transcript_26158:812-1456(-)